MDDHQILYVQYNGQSYVAKQTGIIYLFIQRWLTLSSKSWNCETFTRLTTLAKTFMNNKDI
jgi:hypothetical protein